MRRYAVAAAAALAFAACAQNESPKLPVASGEAAGEPAVALQVVKWPELKKAVAAHKGKIVVLDVWAEY
jgi:hypothetical protein